MTRAPTLLVAGSLIAAVIAAASYGLFHDRQQESKGVEVQPLATSEGLARQNTVKTVASNSGVPPSQHAGAAASYSGLFKDSKNYLEFARSTLAAAKAGNPNAEYYLGKALGYCEVLYRANFYHDFHEISLSEALSLHPGDQRSTSIKQSLYERCHDLEGVKDRDIQFGKAADWMKSASDHGQPAAQSTEALAAIQQMLSTADGAKRSSSSDSDPLALLLTAVESKNPEALITAGYAQGLLNQSYSDKMINQFAWWLVACDRGMDCNINSNFMEQVCQTNSCLDDLPGRETICMMAGADCQVVEQRAEIIQEKLDAGAWDQLGFQAGPSNSKAPNG